MGLEPIGLQSQGWGTCLKTRRTTCIHCQQYMFYALGMRSIMYRQKTELHVVSLYYNTTI
jgi:hypothetical protein